MGVSVRVDHPDDHRADRELQLACYRPELQESIVPHIARLGKGKNFKIQSMLSIECALI